MFGQARNPDALSSPQVNDPNELLRRIDQRTGQMFDWLRVGLLVVILLLVFIALIG